MSVFVSSPSGTSTKIRRWSGGKAFASRGHHEWTQGDTHHVHDGCDGHVLSDSTSLLRAVCPYQSQSLY